MSRFSTTNGKGIEFVWGYDHACGYFVQVWENEDFPFIDESEINLFGFTPDGSEHAWPERILELAKEHGAAISEDKVRSEGKPQVHQEWLNSPNGKMVQKMAKHING